MKSGEFRLLPLGILGIVAGIAGYWNGNLWVGALGTLTVIIATVDLVRPR